MGCAPSTAQHHQQQVSSSASSLTSGSNGSISHSKRKRDSVSSAQHLSQKFLLNSGITCTSISEDLSMLVVGCENGRLTVWSSMSDPVEFLSELSGHQKSISSIRILQNYIISGSADFLIVKWSISSMTAIHIYRGHTSKVNDILCVGNFIFSSSYDRTIRFWYLNLPEVDSDETMMMMTAEQQELKGGDDAQLIYTFRGHLKSVYPLAFIPAGNNWKLEKRISARDILISGSADCTLRIWSLGLRLVIKVLEGHTAPVHKIAVDRSSRQVFTAGGDGLIISWDIVTGDIIRYLRGHDGAVLSLAVHNKMLFSASADRTARAWVMEFGEETRVFRGSQAGVTCVEYFEESGMVFVGCADGTSRAYDAKSGSLKRIFRGPLEPITSLQCSDGKLFTTHADGSFLIWNTTGLKEETVFGSDPRMRDADDDSDFDDYEVKEALEFLDKYIASQTVIY